MPSSKNSYLLEKWLYVRFGGEIVLIKIVYKITIVLSFYDMWIMPSISKKGWFLAPEWVIVCHDCSPTVNFTQWLLY